MQQNKEVPSIFQAASENSLGPQKLCSPLTLAALSQKGQLLFSSTSHWLFPLFELEAFCSLRKISPRDLVLHDKIGGCASALFMVYLNIQHCHVEFLSKKGQAVYQRWGLSYSYRSLIEKVACQTECLFSVKDSPEEAVTRLRERTHWTQGCGLSLQNLYLTFQKDKRIFNGLSLKLFPADRIIIWGENGSGKSTLLRMLMGLLACDSGKISLEWPSGKTSPNIGYLKQEPLLPTFPISVREILQMGSLAQNRLERQTRLKKALEVTQLESLASKDLRTLSAGQRQRVALARCLCQRPPLLLLDEPTAYSDARSQEILREILNRHSWGATTILTSHNQKFCQTLRWPIYQLEGGQLC